MLQDIPTPTLREASSCVLETERLMLRRPTLADVKAIARLANDRRIAENTRRLPHPYLQDHAVEFVRAMADRSRETVFLIENNHAPIGMVGVDWRAAGRAGTRLLARRRALGPGFWHRGRARGDRFHLRGIRRRAADLRRAGGQSVVAQHSGEMRLPVERRRTASLRGAGILDPGRLLQAVARRLVVAEELEQLDEARAVSARSTSSPTRSHRPRRCGPMTPEGWPPDGTPRIILRGSPSWLAPQDDVSVVEASRRRTDHRLPRPRSRSRRKM